MTRTANSRVAGVTFLAYTAATIAGMVLFGQATGGDNVAARLASIAQHPTEMGFVVVLTFVQCFSALALAVTLHAITRAQDETLALFGLVCRVGEGLLSGVSISQLLALGRLAARGAADEALGAHLLRNSVIVPATFFAVGSLAFSWLMLRGRVIPAPLAWLGVAASALLVACLPFEAAGFLRGALTDWMWAPMFAFEIPLAVWLIAKGAAEPRGVRPL